MRYRSGRFLCSLALLAGVAQAQAVLGSRSGVINFTEGTVQLNGASLGQNPGSFSSVAEGATLNTEDGRAEVLLTPGVFLRIDKNSAVRMVSSILTDTQVELLHGSVILDSNEAPASIPDRLVYKVYQMRFLKPGVYRIDSEPGVFETYTGEAEIQSPGEGANKVDESHQFFFNIGMETRKYGEGAVDEFSEWARDRAEKITADNQTAAQSLKDPPDGSNLPLGVVPAGPLGVPSYGIGGGMPGGNYGSVFAIDNGFYNGYTPFGGLPVPNQVLVFYVFPRWYHGNPGNTAGHSGGSWTPHHSGYPVLPSHTYNNYTGIPRVQPLTPMRPLPGLQTGPHYASPRFPVGASRPAMVPAPAFHAAHPAIGARH